jgi:hypothetical protein
MEAEEAEEEMYWVGLGNCSGKRRTWEGEEGESANANVNCCWRFSAGKHQKGQQTNLRMNPIPNPMQ